MQRVQIYLTDEQRSRVADRAKSKKCAQSEVIREILDRGLGIEHDASDALAAIRRLPDSLTMNDTGSLGNAPFVGEQPTTDWTLSACEHAL
jgi:hypothetical protein